MLDAEKGYLTKVSSPHRPTSTWPTSLALHSWICAWCTSQKHKVCSVHLLAQLLYEVCPKNCMVVHTELCTILPNPPMIHEERAGMEGLMNARDCSYW